MIMIMRMMTIHLIKGQFGCRPNDYDDYDDVEDEEADHDDDY